MNADELRAIKVFRLQVPHDFVSYDIADFENGLPEWPPSKMSVFRWLAAHWGLDCDLPKRDLFMAVYEESSRRKPCLDCGEPHRGSDSPVRCDPCLKLMRARHEAERQANKRAAAGRKAAREAMSRLPLGRRQTLERSGETFNSPAEVFYNAFDEVPS